jgi:hypothetical protein
MAERRGLYSLPTRGKWIPGENSRSATEADSSLWIIRNGTKACCCILLRP